jgi:uncharacterized repeat protein (TIGR01451 family)
MRESCIRIGLNRIRFLSVLLVFLATSGAVFGAFDAELQGQSRSSSTWIGGNLQDWRELDYIPCRIYLTGGPATARQITIEFDHVQGRIPAVQNLTGFTPSPNVVITSGPTLSAPTDSDQWTYTFTINLLDRQPGWVEFRARLAAGSHMNVGSSAGLRGTPSLGSLQIHKPSPGLGQPDLVLVKASTAEAAPGEVIHYTLTYSNKSSATHAAAGGQISDVLPPQVTLLTNTVTGAEIVGNFIFWDLGDVPVGASASISYSVRVNGNVPYGQVFTNSALVLSAQDDADLNDNSSSVATRVSFNRVPVAQNDLYSTAEDTPLIVSAPGVIANDSDPDGQTLSAQLGAGPIHGTLVLNSDGSFNYAPAPNFHGSDSFTYRVTDGTAASATATVNITVTPRNDAPVAAGEIYMAAEDTLLTISTPGVLANDSDADGDALTVVLVAGPQHGALTLDANGSFSYMPATDYHGSDTFSYYVTDGITNSSIATATLLVSPGNDAPGAANDRYIVSENSELVVVAPGVLRNDSDRDGDILRAILVSGPAHGALTLSPDGGFTYRPTQNFHGEDSFNYVANDGMLSAAATVSITVVPVNYPPLAADDAYATDEDQTLVLTAPSVLGNDSDADGDALTALLVTGPVHGTLTLNTNGAFTYIPNRDFQGLDVFVYRAADGTAQSSNATVSITVRPVNDPPIAAGDLITLREDLPVLFSAQSLLANDTDLDDDSLTLRILTSPMHGSLVTNASGTLRYSPDANYNGTDTFTYVANDGVADSQAVTVLLNILSVNDQPSFVAGGNVTVTQNSVTRTIEAWATAISAGPSNEATQSLQFMPSVNRPELFSVPPHVSPTGTLTFQPAPGAYGIATVSLVLRDDGGTERSGIDTSVEQKFTIEITKLNVPPVVNILHPTNGAVYIAGMRLTVVAEAADSDGEITSLELLEGNTLLGAANSGTYFHTITSLVAGAYEFRAAGTDNSGATAQSAPVGIAVLAQPPHAAGPFTLNRQTGLFEQRVRITNPTPQTFYGIRLNIQNVRPQVVVWNATGQSNGIPYIDARTEIPAGGSIEMLVTYHCPDVRVPPEPVFVPELLFPADRESNQAARPVIARSYRQADGKFAIEFTAQPTGTYYVQHSEDLRHWQTVPVATSDSNVRWVDADPDANQYRFYRLVYLP